MPCPRCGSVRRIVLAPDRFRCSAETVETRQNPHNPAETIPVYGRCGQEYREERPTIDLGYCPCGAYATVTCEGCATPSCNSCSRLRRGTRICERCAEKVDLESSLEAQRQAADAFLASKNAADSTPMGQALKQLRHFVSDRSPDSVAELADYMSRAGVPTQAFSGKRRHLPFQRKIYGWLVSEGGMDVDGVTRGFTAILSTDGRLWADRDGYLEIRRWTDGPSADEAYEFFRNRNRGY